MAIAHVQTKTQFPGGNATASVAAVTSLSETFASTPAVGDLVVVFLSLASGVPTFSDNQTPHNAWTVESNKASTSGGTESIAWAIITTASGTFTVTASFSSAFGAIAMSEFSGVLGVAPVDVKNSIAGTGSTRTGTNLTPTAPGDLFVSCGTDESASNETFTVPTSYEARGENPNSATTQAMYSASFIAPDSAAHIDTWASTVSITYAQGHVTFKAAPAGGGWLPSQRGSSRNPRDIVRGPGSRFRHATWASTDVGTAPSAVDLGGGIIAGAAVITADLSLAEALAGSIAGQATLTADLRLAEALAGSIAGQGTLTADLKEAIALAGNLAGAATLTADLSLAVALAGAIAGQATLSASLVEAIALSGNIAGIANLAASIALAEALAGNIAGQATVTLDVQTGTPIAGHVSGAALVTADLSLAVALAGSIAGTATITGRLSLPRGTVIYTVFVFDD